MSEQQETSDAQTEQEQHRDYLNRAVEVMQEADDILVVERSVLMRAMSMTSMSMAEPDLPPDHLADLADHMEMLMSRLGEYSIAIQVIRNIGAAALQGLANTGIRVPEAAPILGPDGEVLAKPRKPRKGK